MPASVSAESSPISAMSRVFGWQTTTWPEGAFDSTVTHDSSESCRDSVRSTRPDIVQAGPASFSDGSSGRSRIGSTHRSWPIARSTSWTAPV